MIFQRIASTYRDAFSGLPRTVWLLSAAALVNRAGTMVVPFLGLYLRDQMGLTTDQVSAVLASFGAGAILGVYGGGRGADRFGAVLMQKLSLVFGGLGFLVLMMLEGFEALLIGAFWVGLLADAFRPACMTSIAQAAPRELRTRSLGLLRLFVNLGMAIGPVLGGFLADVDFRLIFIVEAVTCFLAAAMLHRWVPEIKGQSEDNSDSAPETPDNPLANLYFVVFLIVMLGFALVFFQVFNSLPLFLKDSYGFEERIIGTVLGTNAVLIVLFEMPIVKKLESQDPLRVFVIGMAFVGAGFFVLPLGNAAYLAMVMVVLVTIGEILSLPFGNALVAMQAPEAAIGRYMGLYSLSISVGALVAPIIGLGIYGRFGGDTLWWSATGLIAVLCLILTRVRKP